jgi:hypothetical protein
VLHTNYYVERVGEHLHGPQASLDRWEEQQD